MYMTTILCDNFALIKRFFNRIQSSQLQFWIRYPSLLSGSAINWARLRFQKTNFDFRIITSRFSCVSFLSVTISNFLDFFFFPLLTIHHPLTWSHVQACHGIQGYARYLHATPRCLALMLCNTARRKGKILNLVIFLRILAKRDRLLSQNKKRCSTFYKQWFSLQVTTGFHYWLDFWFSCLIGM